MLALVTSGAAAGAAGASLILGQANSAGSKTTGLSSKGTGATLKVSNSGTGRAMEVTSSKGVPLRISGPSGKPPMTVNSRAKVANLNADKVDGLDASAFLRSTRVRAASVNGLSENAGTRILLDPRTGAEVLTGSLGVLRIRNTSATLSLHVRGLCVVGTAVQGINATVAPGATNTFSCQTVYDHYIDVTLMRQANTAANTRFTHLTCSFADSGTPSAVVRSCIAVG